MATPRSFKRHIASQAKEWAEKELISDDQAALICDQYDVDINKAGDRSFGYNILVVLGVLFLALSLITLIGANWNTIPRALRLSVLIALTMSVQGAGLRFYLQEKTKTATNLFFLGNFCFGASIILISQIYHLGEHMPDGIFIWALGCLPFALLTYSALLTFQSLALAVIWFYTDASLGFYPAEFPLFVFASIWVIYKGGHSKYLFNTLTIATVVWFEYSLAKYWGDRGYFSFHAEHLVVSASLTGFAYFLGAFLLTKSSEAIQEYGVLLSSWSLRAGLLAGLVLSFDESWIELSTVEWDWVASMVLVSLALTVAAAGFAKLSQTLERFFYLQIGLLVVISLAIFVDSQRAIIFFQVATNLVLIAIGVSLVVSGIRSSESWNFFSGVGLILLVAMLRYIDLVGNYVGGAALFFVFALIMLGAAYSWKRILNNEAIGGENP